MKYRTKRKVPFIEQRQKTECGVSCVCMIQNYYHYEMTMRELRKDLEVGRDGSTFNQLNELLNKHNFSTKAYNIPAEKISLLETPSIILWDNNHFVVYEGQKHNKVIIVDPKIGRLQYSFDEFSEHFCNYVLVPKPNESFQPIKKRTSPFKVLQHLIFFNKWYYIRSIFISLVLYAFSIALPISIQNIIDDVIMNDYSVGIQQIVIILILVSLLYYLVIYIKSKYTLELRAELDQTLNYNVFGKLLKLPFKYFSVRSSGDTIYSLNSISQIREIFANQFINGLLESGIAIFILMYIYYVNIELGIISSIFFGFNTFIIFLTKQNLQDNSRSLVATQNELQSIQMESVYSILGVKMNAIENDIFKNWKSTYTKFMKKYIQNGTYSNKVNSVLELFNFISPVTILFMSIYLASQGEITIGMIISVYSLSSIFFGLSSTVLDTLTSFINSEVYFSRIADIVTSETEVEEGKKIELDGSIELKNVSYSYTKTSNKILDNINIKIERGSKIAIVGKSGSGKSTLSKLLVGLYSPTEGEILYNDESFELLNKKQVRRQIGIVPQDITLFNNSIFENVVVNRLDVSQEEVVEACRIANIHDEIEAMPMKYHTIISEMGLNLSGGQRQRIALARSLINKPKIILLDEATSFLDSINEKLVSDEFKRIGATQIVIAHRLSTIIDSDVIFVLDEGKVVEQGTHEDLLRQKGQYYLLYSQNELKDESVIDDGMVRLG
ncbi:peptidase domain-containing ABC transporter [Metabacillus litoralis]|uniref:peptidase domain-containing ABC transporter n=1 Tax=Metabacillus litoralis TaxID=152268 RepID=UPI00203E09A6|nr:peptidase domain-containing ABC transporter [Metabacillus litoralis]MCM3410017.1 peptidase domain-containing ABC transporter [Metabacillus litoralis]